MHWKLQSTSKRLFLGRVISPPECTQPKKNFFEEFCTKVNIYSLYDLEPKMRKCPEQLWQFRNYGLAQVSLSISVPFESVILFLSLCIQHQSGKHVSAKKMMSDLCPVSDVCCHDDGKFEFRARLQVRVWRCKFYWTANRVIVTRSMIGQNWSKGK